MILKMRNLVNPLTRQEWENFFRETIISTEGLKIFRSLLIEIMGHTIGSEKLDSLGLMNEFESSENYVLLPCSNSDVNHLIQKIKNSPFLWRFSRYYGYDFDQLMKLLKSYYFGDLPYQLAQVKVYLGVFKKYLIIIIIFTELVFYEAN